MNTCGLFIFITWVYGDILHFFYCIIIGKFKIFQIKSFRNGLFSTYKAHLWLLVSLTPEVYFGAVSCRFILLNVSLFYCLLLLPFLAFPFICVFSFLFLSSCSPTLLLMGSLTGWALLEMCECATAKPPLRAARDTFRLRKIHCSLRWSLYSYPNGERRMCQSAQPLQHLHICVCTYVHGTEIYKSLSFSRN